MTRFLLFQGAGSHEICSDHLVGTAPTPSIHSLVLPVMVSDFHWRPHVILGKRLLSWLQGGTCDGTRPSWNSPLHCHHQHDWDDRVQLRSSVGTRTNACPLCLLHPLLHKSLSPYLTK